MSVNQITTTESQTIVMSRLLLLLMLVVCTSCGDRLIYSDTIDIDKSGWDLNDTLCFEVELTDTLSMIDIGMTISHTDDYPYSNIWLFLEVSSDNGSNFSDTLNYIIAESNGKWVGEKRGKNFVVNTSYRNFVRMAHSGNYRFEIRQGMREERLKGISKLEFRINKSER